MRPALFFMMRTLDVESRTYGARSPTITSGGVNRVIRFSMIAETQPGTGPREKEKGKKENLELSLPCLNHSKQEHGSLQSSLKAIVFFSPLCKMLQLLSPIANLSFPEKRGESGPFSELSPGQLLAQKTFEAVLS